MPDRAARGDIREMQRKMVELTHHVGRCFVFLMLGFEGLLCRFQAAAPRSSGQNGGNHWAKLEVIMLAPKVGMDC